ncbi:hypothetical protein [Lacipirellula limnantheis]|uniref:Uncharacterized protein n=1 Tax=Lacipirellula limnantheis TaxID=2528024 RepID=A0A517TX47_9BACT|nr:hypothetical protein [Lacipirellula limnantheis]QDT72951.1 hypothetical protein I41_21380 [Lacipirellula limnantheis]
MRTLMLIVGLAIPSVAFGQYPSGMWVAGPYQPSPYGGYYYFNPSAPAYRGPVALSPDWYDDFRMRSELRQLRWAIEDSTAQRRSAEFNRRWGH